MWQMRKIRLWEKAGWIIIRSRETARKLGLYMEKERDMRYEKFQTTGQERIRLACALEGFFLTNECEEEKKTAYGQYLKRPSVPIPWIQDCEEFSFSMLFGNIFVSTTAERAADA